MLNGNDRAGRLFDDFVKWSSLDVRATDAAQHPNGGFQWKSLDTAACTKVGFAVETASGSWQLHANIWHLGVSKQVLCCLNWGHENAYRI